MNFDEPIENEGKGWNKLIITIIKYYSILVDS